MDELFVPSRYLTLASAVAAAATALLVALAPRLRWGDAPTASERARKLQDHPVPTVGGTALLVAVALAAWAWGCEGWVPFDGRLWSAPVGYAALGLAFVAGLLDDVRPGGLRVAPKLALQTLATLPLGWAVLADRGLEAAAVFPLRTGALLAALAIVFLALLAMNAVNFFDNSDGAAGGLAALTFCAVSPLVGWALLGFLPFNLMRRTPRAPFAYLGDSGSHLLGMWFVLHLAAWPALCLPVLDSVQVCVARWREGAPLWRADRLHLAHRLERAGVSRGTIVAVLLVVAAPSVVTAWRAVPVGDWGSAAVGMGATAVAYLGALWYAGTGSRRAPG